MSSVVRHIPTVLTSTSATLVEMIPGHKVAGMKYKEVEDKGQEFLYQWILNTIVHDYKIGMPFDIHVETFFSRISDLRGLAKTGISNNVIKRNKQRMHKLDDTCWTPLQTAHAGFLNPEEYTLCIFECFDESDPRDPAKEFEKYFDSRMREKFSNKHFCNYIYNEHKHTNFQPIVKQESNMKIAPITSAQKIALVWTLKNSGYPDKAIINMLTDGETEIILTNDSLNRNNETIVSDGLHRARGDSHELTPFTNTLLEHSIKKGGKLGSGDVKTLTKLEGFKFEKHHTNFLSSINKKAKKQIEKQKSLKQNLLV